MEASVGGFPSGALAAIAHVAVRYGRRKRPSIHSNRSSSLLHF